MNNSVFKKICYCAFFLMLSAIVALMVANAGCKEVTARAIECNSSLLEALATFGAGVMLVCTMTLIPLLLAIAGLFYALVDLWKLLRRERV